MSNPFFHKPDLALRRALELESINQSEAALSLLHEVLSSRRHRTWSPTYEQIMMTYLNLCLKLHKSREAKDGLHQYRNLSQSQAPGSLEKVIRYLMEQAELKCAEATKNADSFADGDVEEYVSPQAILLSTMSTDPGKSQRDSALLLPSLKFLWETYRAVLDILKSNSKLEHVYHSAAVGALRFCRAYKRRTEFRRLCDMLRMHLGNLQKYGSLSPIPDAATDGKSTNGKVRGWEGWTVEAVELHLQTRFAQLETASVLHLYTEGFRTVEDIYNILQISHARRKVSPNSPPPKAKLMAAYYEKLTTLFWVSENYLFHAFAWYKYYTLCCEFHRGMDDETKQRMASAVLLATLCIPATTTKQSASATASTPSKHQQHGITSTVEDDIYKEKMARMATLLGFHTRHPTREALLTEIKANDIMNYVPPYLKELYLLLEENSDPLIMVQEAQPLLEKLRQEVGATNVVTEDEEKKDDGDDSTGTGTTLGRYVQPLTSVLLLKLLLNLSAAYHTVTMDHLQNLTSGLKDVTFDQVEKAMVLFTHANISLKIDHRAGCLRFGDPDLESEAMRYQLTTLSKELQALVQQNPSEFKSASTVSSSATASLYQEVRANLVSEHEAIVERKQLIEQRKEELERIAQEKIKEAERQKRAEEVARKAEEDKRLQREQRLREKEKVLKIQREIEAMEKIKYLEAMGRNVESMTQEEVANIDTAALAKEHADKATKKREEAERKQKEAAKRLDYLVRAIRIEELPLIQTTYQEKTKSDKERYEQKVIEKSRRANLQWEADVKEKAQLQTHDVFQYLADFESLAMAGREQSHQKLCRQEDSRAELEAEKGKLQRARERKEEEIQRKILEEQKRQEEEEQARLAAEKTEREAQRAAEEEKRRQAELTRMQNERDRKEKGRFQPSNRPSDDRGGGGGGSGGGRYVAPSRRGGNDDRGGSSFDRRGGGYGGGRYEGGQQGRAGGGDRWGNRDGDGDRQGGYGGGGDRRGGGGYGDRDRGADSGRGGYGDRERVGGGTERRW